MKTNAAPASGWIHSAPVDLTFFSFGWILVFALFFCADQHWLPRTQSRQWLLIAILAFNFLHRHLTFPLVYGDAEVFRDRKLAYVGLPLFFLALTVVGILYKPLFLFLVVASTLWTIYHTLMQKAGILRIYGRKAGYGNLRLEKGLILTWFFVLVLFLGNSASVRQQASGLASAGRVLSRFFEWASPVLHVLFPLGLIAGAALLAAYVVQEWRHRDRFHWPKNFFVLSIFLLYAVFLRDVFVGYAVFGFSHAIEYLAFVNVFLARKYTPALPQRSWIGRMLRVQWASMLAFFGILILGFFFWRQISAQTLGWYIVGSSFLHFLYDGWIWKLRRQEVAEPLGLGVVNAA